MTEDKARAAPMTDEERARAMIEEVLRNRILFIGEETPNIKRDCLQIYSGSPNDLIGELVAAFDEAYQRGLREGREEALRTLASGMKKVLTAKQLTELKYTCSPLETFLEDLRKPEDKP